jgi:hypothetical protein
MIYEKLKKGFVALAIAGTIILSPGIANNTLVQAQPRGEWHRRDRERERREFNALRRLDYQRRLRYRYQGRNRMVGYYDRFGRFHRFGYYDRFGWFHRY